MLWITPFTSSQIVTTVYANEIFGTGVYKGFWDGVTDEGTYVSSDLGAGGDFLWSAQAWTLPTNAIVVEGGRPVVETPAADPNRFDPATLFCVGTDGCTVDFSLNRDADLVARVFNMSTGSMLREISLPGLLAGSNSFNWDGKADSGEYVDEGGYRVELFAEAGPNASFIRRVLVMVDY